MPSTIEQKDIEVLQGIFGRKDTLTFQDWIKLVQLLCDKILVRRRDFSFGQLGGLRVDDVWQWSFKGVSLESFKPTLLGGKRFSLETRGVFFQCKQMRDIVDPYLLSLPSREQCQKKMFFIWGFTQEGKWVLASAYCMCMRESEESAIVWLDIKKTNLEELLSAIDSQPAFIFDALRSTIHKWTKKREELLKSAQSLSHEADFIQGLIQMAPE